MAFAALRNCHSRASRGAGLPRCALPWARWICAAGWSRAGAAGYLMHMGRGVTGGSVSCVRNLL